MEHKKYNHYQLIQFYHRSIVCQDKKTLKILIKLKNLNIIVQFTFRKRLTNRSLNLQLNVFRLHVDIASKAISSPLTTRTYTKTHIKNRKIHHNYLVTHGGVKQKYNSYVMWYKNYRFYSELLVISSERKCKRKW